MTISSPSLIDLLMRFFADRRREQELEQGVDPGRSSYIYNMLKERYQPNVDRKMEFSGTILDALRKLELDPNTGELKHAPIPSPAVPGTHDYNNIYSLPPQRKKHDA